MNDHCTHDASLVPEHLVTLEHVLSNLASQAMAGASPPGVIPALKRFLRLTQCDPRITPATRAALDHKLEQLRQRWLIHRFSSARAFQNWASLVRRAVRSSTEEKGNQQAREWQELSQNASMLAATRRYRVASVSTIMRLALKDNLGPGDLDTVWLARKASEMKGQAKSCLWRAVAHWNALANLGLHVPQLIKPVSTKTRLGANPAELPESLNEQIESILSNLKTQNKLSAADDPVARLLENLPKKLLSEISPELEDLRSGGLSESYISSIRYYLYRSAGALLRAGTPASSLTSVNRLVTREAGALLAAEIYSRRRVRNAASAHTAVVMLQVVARRLI